MARSLIILATLQNQPKTEPIVLTHLYLNLVGFSPSGSLAHLLPEKVYRSAVVGESPQGNRFSKIILEDLTRSLAHSLSLYLGLPLCLSTHVNIFIYIYIQVYIYIYIYMYTHKCHLVVYI